ncbi:MAG TPA: hypothetical protein VNK04_27310, partial [Gemmataceae bacterium]|nr:hypothetical protein [Gemmataceae bacterium]
LIKDGKPIEEPGQMLLIKNDPNYNEQWPRALVPYKRIYGIDEPPRLPPLANDGKLSPHLPEGTPYGLVGTSSLYKRETYPAGSVPKGGTTAGYSGTGRYGSPLDRGLGLIEDSNSLNWRLQGAEAGLYSNSDIHAIRILAMEPTTLRYPGRRFFNHPLERLRILGEIPVRKFNGDQQPIDPDGNPDTSFLAKIPADIAWTFQTLDKDGMVLNMSQTWHQLRPGEIRNDCGGCHAHSQKPTRFEDTAAARPDYEIFDLTRYTPLLTSKTRDESGKKWDVNDETGLRYESAVKNVEYFRDIKPILERSCVACHTKDPNRAPAGQWLVLDDETSVRGYPAAYYNLVLNANVKPQAVNKRGHYTPSRYIVPMQSRSSLLAWKIYGRRLDGFSNDDFPSPAIPGDPNSLQIAGQPVPPTPENLSRTDTDYTGSVMPPPEAVTGMRLGPDGREIKVEPLTDEDRRTIVRWIDLGCPIDLDYDPAQPQRRGYGWMLDDNRPTLTLTYPRAGANAELSRILIGMDDYYTGLNLSTFEVIADFPVDSVPAGHNLAPRFQEKSQGVWELKLTRPITNLPRGNLLVSIRDRQGNVARIERKFWVSASGK